MCAALNASITIGPRSRSGLALGTRCKWQQSESQQSESQQSKSQQSESQQSVSQQSRSSAPRRSSPRRISPSHPGSSPRHADGHGRSSPSRSLAAVTVRVAGALAAAEQSEAYH